MKTVLAALALVFAVSVVGCSQSAPNCDKYQKCCDALSKMTGGDAMAATCKQIEQLKKADGADKACGDALMAIKEVPSVPAECQ